LISRIRTRAAFLTADLLIGMGIVAVLAVSVFVILSRSSRLASKMSDSRTSARAAETALSDLQAERPVNAPSEVTIDIHSEPGAAAVSGHVWVRVTAALAGQSAELVGLVPDGRQLHDAQSHSTTRPATQEGP